MSRLDIVGILQTYVLRVATCHKKEKIIEIIKELKKELNIKELRKGLKND